MGRFVRSLAAACCVTAVTAALVGCGDDGDSSTGSPDSSAPDTTVAFTGDPVTIGAFIPTEANPVQVFPESVSALEAAVNAVNTRGGLAGHEVELFVCDPKENANDAADCAQQFVDRHVIAVVGSFSSTAAVVQPVLESHGIANLGANPASQPDFSSETSFPLDAGTIASFATAPLEIAAQHGDKVAAVYLDVAAAQIIPNFVEAGADAAGISYVGKVGVPPGAADLAPYIASVTDLGAESVVMALPPQDAQRFMTAAQQAGADLHFAYSAGGFRRDQVDSLGDLVNGMTNPGSFPPQSSADLFPGYERYLHEMETQADTGDEHATAEFYSGVLTYRPWLSVQVLEMVADSLADGSTLDAAAVLGALQSGSFDMSDYGLPTLSWAEPGPVTIFPRIVNFNVYFQSYDDGELRLIQDDPVDIAGEIDFAAALGG